MYDNGGIAGTGVDVGLPGAADVCTWLVTNSSLASAVRTPEPSSISPDAFNTTFPPLLTMVMSEEPVAGMLDDDGNIPGKAMASPGEYIFSYGVDDSFPVCMNFPMNRSEKIRSTKSSALDGNTTDAVAVPYTAKGTSGRTGSSISDPSADLILSIGLTDPRRVNLSYDSTFPGMEVCTFPAMYDCKS
jgi:hypothetical protein